MKSLSMKFSITLLCCLTSSILFAGKQEEMKRTINKTYPVQSKTMLEVSNQFGEIEITTWDKKELKVDIEIIVMGRNDRRAQELLDKIEVDIEESGSAIAFQTDFGNNMNTRSDESFEVNYFIKLPAENEIEIENKFGDTFIGSRSGTTRLDISYGNVKTADLSGPLELELSFGKGYLGKTTESEIEVEYAELEMGDAAITIMEQQFSDVSITSVDQLELESKYGNVKIESANVVTCDVQFSGFTIDRLSDRIYMEANYVSNFKIGELSSDFSSVEFYGKFSGAEINLQKGLSADLEASFSFADLDVARSDVEFYYQAKEDHRSEYKGKINGGDPDRKIIVESSYGNLRLR